MRRILLVDDQMDAIVLLARMIERRGQCEVRCIDNPLRAADLAAEFLPDGVVLDLGMPLLDGYTLAQQLRRIPALEHARIVAVSGYPPDEERLAKAQIDAHLLKPVASKVLLDVLFRPAEARS